MKKAPPLPVRLATADIILLSVLIALLVRLFQQIERGYATQPRKARLVKNELRELVREQLPAVNQRWEQRNADYFAFEADQLSAMDELELDHE